MSRSPPGKLRGSTILLPTSEALVSPAEITSTKPYIKIKNIEHVCFFSFELLCHIILQIIKHCITHLIQFRPYEFLVIRVRIPIKPHRLDLYVHVNDPLLEKSSSKQQYVKKPLSNLHQITIVLSCCHKSPRLSFLHHGTHVFTLLYVRVILTLLYL